jgi:hypothetical protein
MPYPRLPAEIEAEMKLWRNGFVPMPQSYIRYHEEAARADLAVQAPRQGWTVHNTYIADDGWMDGCKFLHAIIELRDGTLMKIKWSDSHAWYEKLSAGWGLLSLNKAAMSVPTPEPKPEPEIDTRNFPPPDRLDLTRPLKTRKGEEVINARFDMVTERGETFEAIVGVIPGKCNGAVWWVNGFGTHESHLAPKAVDLTYAD